MIGLDIANDAELWNYAPDNDYFIISKEYLYYCNLLHRHNEREVDHNRIAEKFKGLDYI